jgi:protoheme IX farnesyltransferase
VSTTRVSSAGAAPAAAARARRSPLALGADLVRLSKPRITVMVIVTALGGMWLAARTGHSGSLSLSKALLSLLGISLVVSGANALNMYLERETDAFMARTANRPLPAGRMAPATALAFGVTVSALSLPLLGLAVNLTTAVLAGLSLALYVLAYTPLKRVTSRALLVGAIPGAMPPLLGWTAATGRVDALGLALFAVLFFWQLPHFVAIATFREREYTRAGIKVLPAERGARVARLHAVVYLAALLLASLTLVPLGVGGPVYLVAATVLGGGFLAMGVWGLTPEQLQPGRGDRWARRVFVASLLYLPALIAAMMMGA